MAAFLTGFGAAALLAVITFFVLDGATITSVERIDNMSINVADQHPDPR